MEPKGEPKGLYGKYRIEKGDGTPVDPEAIYFTIRLDTDKHARAAAAAYIRSCKKEQPELAEGLRVLLEVARGRVRLLRSARMNK
jgi:hypothetical protein